MKSKDGAGLARVRNEKIGFVFQFHYLLPEFSVLRNVMLPAQKLGLKSEDEIEAKAMEHLKMLGIADQALKNANMLSGGQKQRVAIARALINDPLIIMGDEPTGNLDSKNSAIVFDLFKEIAATGNRSLLVVTHDEDIARGAQRNIVMDDGRMVK
jgi:lipoprotein-releasing system ATP-binding protein